MKNLDGKLRVNELIHVCKDSANGFRLAAGEVENKAYREYFQRKALERADFVRNLEKAALQLGIVPATNGTLMGTFHRMLMKLRHQLNPHRDGIALSECRRGEEHALRVYEEVIENHVLPQIEPVLEQQFVALIETRDTLRNVLSNKKEESISESVLHLQ